MSYSYQCAYMVQKGLKGQFGAYIITNARNKYEALGYAHDWIYSAYPVGDGWSNHSTDVTIMVDKTIELMYNELLERRKDETT